MLALRQLANEPAPPAKRPRHSQHPAGPLTQHPAGPADDEAMVLRPRRQHPGLVAHTGEHPSMAAAAFLHGHALHSGTLAAQQQQAGAFPGAAQHPAGARWQEHLSARFGQHAASAHEAGAATGGEPLLRRLLGALLQAGGTSGGLEPEATAVAIRKHACPPCLLAVSQPVLSLVHPRLPAQLAPHSFCTSIPALPLCRRLLSAVRARNQGMRVLGPPAG